MNDTCFSNRSKDSTSNSEKTTLQIISELKPCQFLTCNNNGFPIESQIRVAKFGGPYKIPDKKNKS